MRRVRGTRAGLDRLAAAPALAVVLALGGAPAAASGQGTPPTPGPPPGAGADLPPPPAPGSLPAAPPSPGAAVDPAPAGPNLLTSTARLDRRGHRVALRIYCRAGGRARLHVPRLGRRGSAVARYRCRGRRATATLRLHPAAARRLARLRSVPAEVTLRQGATVVRAAVTITTGRRADAPLEFWSDGSLQCSPTGRPEAYLVAPNWTATPPTAIYLRPWVAVYNGTTGWQWIGVAGPRRSRWIAVTATPTGVAEWKLGDGILRPWTWGPISMPQGYDTYAIGVFEVVYWWSGGPRYVSSHVRASATGLDASTGFCRYF